MCYEKQYRTKKTKKSEHPPVEASHTYSPAAMDRLRPALSVQLARRAAEMPPLAIITAIGSEDSAATPASRVLLTLKTFEGPWQQLGQLFRQPEKN